ncbi:hypothetical protein AHML_09620 [Aeromonas hydrophila ML09-119]|nr:hypothetical protein AHML_09620 [Aeromonas hydrophila ML09-119]
MAQNAGSLFDQATLQLLKHDKLPVFCAFKHRAAAMILLEIKLVPTYLKKGKATQSCLRSKSGRTPVNTIGPLLHFLPSRSVPDGITLSGRQFAGTENSRG